MKSKRLLLATAITTILSFSVSAWGLDPSALPTGGNISSGQGGIATGGNTMTVSQASNRMVADWSTFNIGRDASVTFQQPGSASVALNRIHDTSPSQIFGSLAANGQVFLLNPAGVIFGPSAQVDVGGLVASSLNLSDEDFMNGTYQFETSGTAGAVVNQGRIRTADGGYVAFLSPQVGNQGEISAPLGTVAMAAGDTVSLDFVGDRLINYEIDRGAVDALVENSGSISADGGAVLLTARAADELTSAVVNNSGVIEAGSLVEKNGRIVLTADEGSGDIRISGTLDVSGTEAGATGGTVIATGHEVTLDSGATIDASGSAGGGEVYVGGGWQGDDETIANASYVTADESVEVVADALDNGDGGTVVFWSDDQTAFAGNISVRGGNSGGDGGSVEVSGKHKLAYTGLADARAPFGNTGDLLLDPDTIQILDGGSGAGAITGDTIYEADLEAQMANITLTSDTGSVTLQDLTTDGVLQLQNNISLTINSADDFIAADTSDEIRLSGTGALAVDTGSAGGQLTSCKITTESGSVRLWGDDGLTVGNTITTAGGDVNLWGDSDDGGAGVLYINHGITTAGGDVDLDAGGSGVYVNADVSTGAGRLYFDREGSVMGATYRLSAKLSSTGDVDVNQTLQFGTGAEVETTGTITFSGFSSMQNAGASLTLTAAAFDFQQNLTGNSGSITLKPNSTGTNVDIGSAGAGDMTITNANLARLVNFSNITIGREDGTGTTTVVSDGSAAATGIFTLVNDTINITGGTITNTVGDVVLSANTLNLSQTVTADSGDGSVAIQQATAANPITLGSGITQSILNQLSAETVKIGRTNGGAVTLDSDITSAFDGLYVLTGGDITMNNGATLDVGTGTGILAAGGNFINNAGSGAISTSGDGRWLIYSTDPAANTFGDLASGNSALWNKTYAGYPPESVTETGNRYLFSFQPSATVVTLDRTKTYGQALDLSSPSAGTDYTMTGLVDASSYGNVFTQDTAAGVVSGNPAMASAGSAAGAAVADSPYALTIAAGTLTAKTGYDLANYTAGTVTVNRAPLTVTANDDSKTYDGIAYSGGNGASYSGFVNSESTAVLGGSLTIGGTSQGAVYVGNYSLAASGLTSDNYDIRFIDGTLTIRQQGTTPANLVSPQKSINGSQLDPQIVSGGSTFPPLGPGSGSVTLEAFANTSLIAMGFEEPLPADTTEEPSEN